MSPKEITLPLDLYIRVSRVGGREGDSFISPELQEEKCRALAKARGLRIGHVFTDLDRSGGKMDRPEFNRALERIDSGQSGGIIVARIDRFARTLVGGVQAINDINEAGGVVLTADGEFDTSTATGELVLSIMLSLAQFELRRIRESWADAQQRAKARGVHVAKPRLGYDRADGRLVENEHLQAVKDVFVLRAGGGTWGEAVRLLSARGVPTWRGGPWSRQSVRHVVSNPAYRDSNGGPIPGWQWDKAQVSTSFRAMRGEGYILGQGLCRCANCGAGMVRTHSKGETYLRCPTVGKGHVAIAYDKAEDYILSVAFSSQVGWMKRVPEGGDGKELRQAVDAARAEVAAIEEQIGTTLPADSKQRRALEQAEAELAEWQARVDAPFDVSDALTPVGVRREFDKLPMHERRRFLRQLVSKVTVSPGLDEARRRVHFVERIAIEFADGTTYGEHDEAHVPIPHPSVA